MIRQVLLILFTIFGLNTGDGFTLTIDWTNATRSPATLGVAVSDDQGSPVLAVTYHDKKGGKSSVLAPLQIPAGSHPEGITFEMKGEGDTDFASVFLTCQNGISLGYEAIFPARSNDWQKVTLRWSDFAQNNLPWDPKVAEDKTTFVLEPDQVTGIGFGIGAPYEKRFPKTYSLKIKNITLVDHLPALISGNDFSKGLARTLSALRHQANLNILLLGDSITDFGKDQNYGYFCGKKIQATWGNTCVIANAGIAGHTVRYGRIILPFSLEMMPDPDLICVLFGANDCKITEFRPGYNDAGFKLEMEALIDKVREATGGRSDIIVINGVPRLTPDQMTSTGIIEKILNGAKMAADEKQTAFLDTFSVYLAMDPTKRKALYKDTIHQNPAGLEQIGDLLFEKIQSEMAQQSATKP